MFQKWNEKVFFGILDFMLAAWNISAQDKAIIRDTVNNNDWRVYVAKLMLN